MRISLMNRAPRGSFLCFFFLFPSEKESLFFFSKNVIFEEREFFLFHEYSRNGEWVERWYLLRIERRLRELSAQIDYKREREKKKRKLPTFLDTLYLLLFMFIRMIYIYETEIIPWISIMP